MKGHDQEFSKKDKGRFLLAGIVAFTVVFLRDFSLTVSLSLLGITVFCILVNILGLVTNPFGFFLNVLAFGVCSLAIGQVTGFCEVSIIFEYPWIFATLTLVVIALRAGLVQWFILPLESFGACAAFYIIFTGIINSGNILKPSSMMYIGMMLGPFVLGEMFFVDDSKKKESTGNKVKKGTVVVKIGNNEWTLRDFVRGWSILGKTGSGKTISAINNLMVQVTKNCSDWGGVLVDQKGTLCEVIEQVFAAFNYQDRVVKLETKPVGSPNDWKPKHCYNILSNSDIPASTYAKLITDTAASVAGGSEGKGFFKTQAAINIEKAIDLLATMAELKKEPRTHHLSLQGVFDLLSSTVSVNQSLQSFNSIVEERYYSNFVNDEEGCALLLSPISDQEIKAVVSEIGNSYSSLMSFKEKGRDVIIYSKSYQLDNELAQTGTASPDAGHLKVPYHPLGLKLFVNAFEKLSNEKRDVLFERFKLVPEDLPLINKSIDLLTYFNESFLSQPSDQLGGVVTTITNSLKYFSGLELAPVFSCKENSIDFKEIDNGKVFVISMPQMLEVERNHVNTLFKLFFYIHALHRFDIPEKEREKKNLLIFWADEAQGVVTDSGGGFSDYNIIDRTREAKATVVFATQSLKGYLPKLKKDKSDVLLANLTNRICFTAADPFTADEMSKLFGKEEIKKKTSENKQSKGGKSHSFSFVDEAVFKPQEILGLNKFEAIVQHCEGKPVRMFIPPVDGTGKVFSWFKEYKKK